MWGCVACNFCVTVCPNDAFFKLPTPELEGIEGRQQYLVLSELCNECGNCLTFCPEEGDPAMVKPRLYLDRGRFDAADGPRFFVEIGAEDVTVEAAGGVDAEVPTLLALLNAPEGFPVR
jgi:putative selenate reductase